MNDFWFIVHVKGVKAGSTTWTTRGWDHFLLSLWMDGRRRGNDERKERNQQKSTLEFNKSKKGPLLDWLFVPSRPASLFDTPPQLANNDRLPWNMFLEILILCSAYFTLLNIHISFLRSLFQRWLVTFNKVYESPAGKLNICIEKSNKKSREEIISTSIRSFARLRTIVKMEAWWTSRLVDNVLTTRSSVSAGRQENSLEIRHLRLDSAWMCSLITLHLCHIEARPPHIPFSSENEPDELCKLRRNHKEMKSNFIIFKTSDRMHRRDRKKSKRSKYLIKVSLGPICVLSMREREGRRWSVISISQVKLNNFVNDSTPFMCLFRISRERAVWYNGKKEGMSKPLERARLIFFTKS